MPESADLRPKVDNLGTEPTGSRAPPTARHPRSNLLRGSCALFFVFIILAVGDPVQRFVIAPLSRLIPSRRLVILSWWQHVMRWLSLSPIVYIGGARFPKPVAVPGGSGTLILMNHQSIFDIPTVVECLPYDTYPRFVTRKRYFSGIPMISHLTRLYGFPSVDPQGSKEDMRKSLASIRDAARNSDVPMCIFPEGTRTKDGEIGPFQAAGLKLILKQRPWTIYVLVGDGYWRTAKMKDFVRGMSDVRGKLELAGVFEWPDPKQKSEALIHDIRESMVERLAKMRQAPPA